MEVILVIAYLVSHPWIVVVFISSFILFCVINHRIEKKRIEEEQLRLSRIEYQKIEERHRKQEEQRRKQEERSWKSQRKIESQLEKIAYRDIDAVFSKSAQTLRTAMKASTFRVHIQKMEYAVDVFKKEHGDYPVKQQYLQAIESAKKEYERLKSEEAAALAERAKSGGSRKADLSPEVYEERKKMTNSLRYEILKRDGFKCVICGRTPDDGVKLHVDHILPVSKGGKTVPSNLRTLCADCNLGKSNKIESSPPIPEKNPDSGMTYSQLIDELTARNIRYKDKRKSGGRFWMISSPENDEYIKNLYVEGKKPRFILSAKTFDQSPGWYL